MIPLLARRWYCPNCPTETVTGDAAIPYHPCKGLTGITAPLVPIGVRAEVKAVERGDYIGEERVQTFNGRPVMSVVTNRADGSHDTAVFAPTAVLRSEHG
jgi:hypothetical protein